MDRAHSVPRKNKYFLSIVIVLLTIISTVQAKAQCTDPKHHPLYSTSIKPVLIKCWSFMDAPKLPRTAYMPRYNTHQYAPASDLSSTMYENVDWFWASSGHGTGSEFIQFHFNRRARVYLTVPMHKFSEVKDVSLPGGWIPVGEVSLIKGNDKPFEIGVYQKLIGEDKLSERAFVFMKRGKDISIPHMDWLLKYAKGFTIPKGFRWIAMISEVDGSKWEVPSQPKSINKRIKPNTKCPKALHDKWVTSNTDENDRYIQGKKWTTWHPLWDPIYYCTYGHEHGSSPVDFMGYWPKYSYTSYKNNREVESNEGFKTLCMVSGKYGFCYTVHMQTSQLRRVYERWHSISIAVVYLRTRKLVAEVTHKGDFGALMVRIPFAKFMPVSYDDEMIMKEIDMYKAPRRRSINVISDTGKIDRRLQYRTPSYRMSMGTYEDWTTVPVCAGGGRRGNLRADVTKSATGIPALDRKDEKVLLGRYEQGKFIRQAGVSRILIARDFIFSSDECVRMFGDNAMKNGGVFYTNAMGTELRSGPGKDHMRQYVEPGLRIDLNGEYRAVDTFTGFMKLDSTREMEDINFGADPDKN